MRARIARARAMVVSSQVFPNQRVAIGRAARPRESSGIPADDQVGEIFHFWEDPPRVLGLIRARMAPGGLLAITHQPRHRGASSADTRASADGITADLRAAGFSELRAEMLGTRPVETVCVLGRAPAEAE